jgi:hypothetical protein
MTNEAVSRPQHALGAAGCLYSDGSRCEHLQRDLAGFVCNKYHAELSLHHAGEQPWRAQACGEEANVHTWANIMRNRA